MVAPLFAMPPPYVLLSLPICFLLVLLIAGPFLTAAKTRGTRCEQDRRAGLGLLAILCGPLVGASLALLTNTLGMCTQPTWEIPAPCLPSSGVTPDYSEGLLKA
jgi:hypothetical protein